MRVPRLIALRRVKRAALLIIALGGCTSEALAHADVAIEEVARDGFDELLNRFEPAEEHPRPWLQLLLEQLELTLGQSETFNIVARVGVQACLSVLAPGPSARA